MSRLIKQKKLTYFIGSAIQGSKVIQREIEAFNFIEAQLSFTKEVGVKPSILSGPFFKKRGCNQEHYTNLRFAGPSKKAIYDDWHVIAQLLLEPENTAYLFFDKRVDGKNIPRPSGHFVVDLQCLRF